MLTVVLSNKEIKCIMKLVKYLEESGLLPEDFNKTIEDETKTKKVDFSACY